MNKRNLALLISKHPLIELLKKDKTLPNSVVARLIAEELMEAPAQGEFYVGPKKSPGLRVRNNIKQIMDRAIKKEDVEAITAASEKIKNFPKGFDNIEGVSEEHLEILKNFSAHTVSRGVEQVKILLAAEQSQKPEDIKKIQQAQQKLYKKDAAVDQRVTQALEEPEGQDQPEEYKRKFKDKPSAEWLSDLNLTTKTVGLTEPQLKDFAVLVAKLIEKSKKHISAESKTFNEANGEFISMNDTLASAKKQLELVNSDEAYAVREFLGGYSTNLEAASRWLDIFFNSLANPEEEEEVSPDVVDTVTKKAEEEIDEAPVGQEDVKTVVAAETEEVVPGATPEQKAEIEKQVLAKLSSPEKMVPLDTTQEPGEEEKPTIDPEKFDVDPELLNRLIEVSEVFIDEFYEKAFLKDQGILLKGVLTVLATIVEKEELEKAARRTSKPTEQPEEAEETETLQEEEDLPRQDPVKLRNIQVDLKSFIKLIKRSKDVLKAFDEFRAKGKVVGSSYKEKFMNILKQLQKNIKALVRDISSLNLISEKKDVSETENKWSAIEKGYNEASRSLSNIVAAGAEDIESFDMEKNVNDAYTSLMSISGFFPSVNPFGAKTTKFNEYNELYTAAVKNVKSTIRDALELAKGQGGSNTANNTIESLKEFSGQIQSIFGVASQFKDVQVQPNEEAAEETSPNDSDTETPQEPGSNIDQKFNEQLRRLTPNQIAAFLNKEPGIIAATFLKLVSKNDKFTQKLADVIKSIGDAKIQAQIITAMTKEVSIDPELIEDLKSAFVAAAREMPSMIDLEGSLRPTLEKLRYDDFNAYNELKDIASDEQTEDLLAVIKDVDDKDQFINQMIDGPKRQELEKYLTSSEANQTLSDFLIKIKSFLKSDENLQEIEIRRRTKGGALKVFLEKLAAYLSGDLGDVTVEKLTDLWNEDNWANKEGKKALIDAYRIPLFADPELTGSVIRKAVQKTFPESNFEDEEGDWNQEEYDEEEEEEIDDDDISDFVDQDETGSDKDEEEDTENTEDKQKELELKIRAELKELVDGKVIDLWYFVDPDTNVEDLKFYEPKEKEVPIADQTKDIMGDATSGDDNAEGYYDLAAYDGSYALVKELSMTYQHDARGAEQILKRIKKFRTENPIGDGEEDVEESLSPEFKMGVEEQLANKLKPLIKEMLTKGNKK
jgi:hypothetical protein